MTLARLERYGVHALRFLSQASVSIRPRRVDSALAESTGYGWSQSWRTARATTVLRLPTAPGL